MSKEKLVQELLEMTGAIEVSRRIANMELDRVVRNIQPALSEEQKKTIQVMLDETINQFVKQAKVIYADLFSEEDLREIVLFYRTNVGRKLIGLLPTIMERQAEIMSSVFGRATRRLQEIL